MFNINRFILYFFIYVNLKTILELPHFMPENYDVIPKLHELDDFNRCMEKIDGLYCTVKIQLLENNSSKVPSKAWDTIKELNANNLKYFRHDVIHRGLCLSERFNITSKNILLGDPQYERNILNLLGNHNSLQKEFLTKYNLATEITIEKCKHNGNEEITVLQWIFAVVIILLILFTIVGSFIDNDNESTDYSSKILLAFSFKNNLKKSLKVLNISETDAKKKSTYMFGIQGLRTMVMIQVIVTHALIYITNTYLDNPHILEWIFGNENSKIYYNAPVVMQIFLCLSGFLMSYNFYKVANIKGDVDIRAFPFAVVKRWLRFAPVYIFTMCYICLWSQRINNDLPLLKGFYLEEKQCKQTWLYNMLYINNKDYESSRCIIQTWFLATDTQLYSVMALIMIVTWKMRDYTKYILGGCLAISAFMLSYTIYVNKYTPFMLISPELLRNIFENDVIFREVYIKMYSNAVGYIVGVIGGYILYQIETKKLVIENKKFLEMGSRAILPVSFCVISSGALIYNVNTDPENGYQGGIIAAVYASINRGLIAAAFVVFLIAMATNTEYYGKIFFESKPMVFLGSLTYSALMIHMVVQNYLLSSVTLFNVNIFSVPFFYLQSVVLTFIAAFFVYFIIELPFHNLLQMYFHKKMQAKSKTQ